MVWQVYFEAIGMNHTMVLSLDYLEVPNGYLELR